MGFYWGVVIGWCIGVCTVFAFAALFERFMDDNDGP